MNNVQIITPLEKLVRELIPAVERERKGISGLAVAFAEKIIDPLRQLSALYKDDPGGRLFWGQCERLRAALINSTDSFTPKELFIQGGLDFQNKVRAIIKTLPLDVQRFVGRACAFHEIGKDAKYAGCISTLYGVRTIAIAAGLNDQKLKETVFHELSHAVLQHQSGGQFEEAMADIKMREWIK
jgi:hypothetical protein